MNEEDNNFPELAAYFGVDKTEFIDFWLSCNPRERQYYRHVDLVTGLVPPAILRTLEFL